MKKLRTLYLIAAEDGFRLLHTHAPELTEITPKAAEPAASPQTPGTAHKVEEERLRFAHHIVAALEAEWAKGLYDRIVIAAGPKMLGHLRSALPKSLHAHVAAELHKDLMKTPAHELASHFTEVSEA